MKLVAVAAIGTLLLATSSALADEARTDEVEESAPSHAPEWSLWTGARTNFLAFGRSFFENDPRRGLASSPETTGNFAGPGFAPQIDIGARLGKRFVPYGFYEHGFMGQGHRFAGTDATSSTDSFGLGCRFGGADELGFIADLSVGRRLVHVSRGNDTFTMSSWEVFRLALGGEFRLSTLMTVEATASIGGGSVNESSGDVLYGVDGSGDGRLHPAYKNNGIDRDSSTYLVFALGIGAHFDVFGR